MPAEPRKCRILWVDDNPEQNVFEAKGLRILLPAEIRFASTYEEAKSKLDKENFDIVILDLLIPSRDGRLINGGILVLKYIEALSANSSAPVVIIHSAGSAMEGDFDKISLPVYILRKSARFGQLLDLCRNETSR